MFTSLQSYQNSVLPRELVNEGTKRASEKILYHSHCNSLGSEVLLQCKRDLWPMYFKQLSEANGAHT